MKAKDLAKATLAAAAVLGGAALLRGDAVVPFGAGSVVRVGHVLSAGGSVGAGGQIHNVGQTVIGDSAGGAVDLHAGALAVMVRYTPLPEAPTALATTVVGGFTVDLEWTDGSSNEDGFLIQRREGGGPFAYLDTAGADQTAYTDSACTPDTDYAYRVCAVRDEARSDWSNQADAETPMPGDTDLDGFVGNTDASTFVDHWLESGCTWSDGDFTDDGFVGNKDASLLLDHWLEADED